MSLVWLRRIVLCSLIFLPSYSFAWSWCGYIPNQPGKLRSVFMVADGYLRHYGLYLPKNYQAKTPLLLSFHGQSSNKFIEYNASCWKQAADRHGFAVVYPQGIGVIPTWNGGEFCCNPRNDNDVDFALKILDCLADEKRSPIQIDHDRVYAVGTSNGAAFAGRLACEQSEKFAGVAAVAQSFPYGFGEQCRYPKSNQLPFTVLETRGLYDVIVPHDFSWSWSLPAAESRHNWKTAQGCVGDPQIMDVCDRPGSGSECEYGKARCRVYSNCEGGVTVTQCSLREGHGLYGNGHQYNICEDAWFEFQR